MKSIVLNGTFYRKFSLAPKIFIFISRKAEGVKLKLLPNMEKSDWELSKENIQPLRSGRKAATLAKVGLSCRTTKEMQDIKR